MIPQTNVVSVVENPLFLSRIQRNVTEFLDFVPT